MNAWIASIILLLMAPAVLSAQERGERRLPTIIDSRVDPLNDEGRLLARFKVVKKDGEEEGYDYTRLRVSDDDGYLNCLLICINRGYRPAMIDTSELVQSRPPRLIAFAEEQIILGALRGSYHIIEANVRYAVTWHAVDGANATIEEIQRALK